MILIENNKKLSKITFDGIGSVKPIIFKQVCESCEREIISDKNKQKHKKEILPKKDKLIIIDVSDLTSQDPQIKIKVIPKSRNKALIKLNDEEERLFTFEEEDSESILSILEQICQYDSDNQNKNDIVEEMTN